MSALPTLDDVMAKLVAIEAKVDAALAGTPRAGAPTADRAKAIGGDAASDFELDDKFGDVPIRKDPSAKYWTGKSYKGEQPSRCPIDYLVAQARYKDACAFMGEKNADPSKANYIEYDRRDARLFRGWIRRLESGWKPKAGPSTGLPFDAEDANTDASRYGTSGHSASAKHTGTPENDAFDVGGPSTVDAATDDDSIPFATCAPVPARHVRMPRWERW